MKRRNNRRHASNSTIFSGMIGIFAAMMVITGIVFSDSFPSLAQEDLTDGGKYYKSITVEKGDTLWNIAEEYITDDYNSIEEYVSVLMGINNLSTDKILAGDHLVIVYDETSQR